MDRRSTDLLIDRLYEFAENGREWTEALVAVASSVSAPTSHLFMVERGTGNIVGTHYHGSTEADVALYEQRYLATDPRYFYSLANPGRMHTDVEASPDFERTPIYNELLARQDIRYSLFGHFQLEPDAVCAAAFMRSKAAGPFEREEVAHFQWLLPHLGRAVRLRWLLERTREQVRDLQHALDLLPVPVAILDGTGRLRGINRRGDEVLARTPELFLKGQRLTAKLPRQAATLARAIAQTLALAEAEGVNRRTRAVPPAPPVAEIDREDRRPLGLVFLPLRERHGLRHVADANARMLVVFHDPEDRLQLNPDLLARLYGLTPTEALLAASLAEGVSVTGFAVRRGITEHTVRTHVKRLLEKTGARRQADLVGLLLSSAALHLAGAP